MSDVCCSEKGKPKLSIRHGLRDDDVKAIRDIVYAERFFTVDDLFVLEEMAWEFVHNGTYADYSFVVAESETAAGLKIVGFACFGPVGRGHKDFYLYWLMVTEKARGHGVGSALLSSAEEGVAARKGKRLYTDSAGQDEADQARVFFAARGYTEDFRGHRYFEPMEGQCMLSKAIESIPQENCNER